MSFGMMGRHGSHAWDGRRDSVTGQKVRRVCSGVTPGGVDLGRGATDGGGRRAGMGGGQQLLSQKA